MFKKEWFESKTTFKDRKRNFCLYKKCFLQKPVKSLLDIFTRWFLCLLQMKPFWQISLIGYSSRECMFLFLVHIKDDQSRDQIIKSAPNTRQAGRLARGTQTFIWNFPICIDNIIKYQFGLLLFWKTWKYPSPNTKEKNYLICQFKVRVSCPTKGPWDSSQSHESHLVWNLKTSAETQIFTAVFFQYTNCWSN